MINKKEKQFQIWKNNSSDGISTNKKIYEKFMKFQRDKNGEFIEIYGREKLLSDILIFINIKIKLLLLKSSNIIKLI